MAGSIGRRLATTGVAAVLTTGLAGCAGVSWTPYDVSTAQPQGMTRPSTSPSTTAPVAPSATASPTSTPTASVPTTTPSPRVTASPRPSTPAKPKPAPSSPAPTRDDLRPGDRGPEVLALQQRLSALGYWMGEPDGRFGSLTQQAVWALQKSAGISRDGRVGPRTQRALDDGIRPGTRLTGDGIDIDLSRQILLVVRDGRVRHILNTSTGGGYTYERKDGSAATARTPKGTFRVYYTVDGRDEGFLGEMWRPRYFKGGYAVHGSPSIPPQPASHGCARVSNAAMDMIWARDYMPKGSTVLVR